MNNFPEIKTIDDVLPAIKDRDEFFAADRSFGTVINYHVALPDSFNDPIRRECRGLVFYPSGRLMSRPFHKFFNYGEKPMEDVTMDFSHSEILEKLDGSMIRPIWNEPDPMSKFVLGTKMGYTDVGYQAQSWIEKNHHENDGYYELMYWCLYYGVTPIFEWCSPQNRIVIPYQEDQLILLAMRENLSGKYYAREKLKLFAERYNIPLVRSFGRTDLPKLLESAKQLKDTEGWVATFMNGHRVKVKVDWYVDLHKAKDSISREKYVIEAILNDFIDDLKGKLQDSDRTAVETFETEFKDGLWQAVHDCNSEFIEVCKKRTLDLMELRQVMEESHAQREAKKRFALASQSMPAWKRSILFTLWDDASLSPYTLVVNTLRKMTKSQVDIDRNRSIWGGAKYIYSGGTIDA